MCNYLKKLSDVFVAFALSLMGISTAFAEGAAGKSREFFQNLPKQTMMADSPMTDYTVRVMIYMLIIGILLSFLLGGAFAVINLGLLSKREEDRTGKRDPSDFGVLKRVAERELLPAEEGDMVDFAECLETRKKESSGVRLLKEDEMAA
jgi:hypothetical protein